MTYLDQIYYSAHYEAAEHQGVNENIRQLLRWYNFTVFFPQDQFQTSLTPPFEDALRRPLDLSKLMLAVFHETIPSEQMRYELGEARRRKLPLVLMLAPGIHEASVAATDLEGAIRVIHMPENEDDLIHPLMTTLNRYFPV